MGGLRSTPAVMSCVRLFSGGGGQIATKVVEDDVLPVLLALAANLGARVRGDELETYRGLGDTYVHPDDAQAVALSERQDSQRRQRLLLWKIIRVALLVSAIAALLLRTLR